jgi:hypothetical protein
MSYATSNPPKLLVGSFAGVGASIWSYVSTDAAATIDDANYFTDGDVLGMKVGDWVLVYDTTNSLSHIFIVITVTAGSGATVNGTANNLDLTMS